MTTAPLAPEQILVQRLLAGLTPDEIRGYAIRALRAWWRARPDLALDSFSLHGDFGWHMVAILADMRGEKLETEAHRLGKEPFLSDQHRPWMKDVVEFLWWLTRVGLAFPLLDTGNAPYFGRMRVTAAGARFLSSDDQDHALLPVSLERVRQRCPGLPDQVLAHLEDGRACLDHGLPRPAVVLIGLAYEAAVEAIVENLVANGLLDGSVVRRQTALGRIALVTALLPNLFADREAMSAATAAWAFADHLRKRRNDASHTKPAYDFTDIGEVHEFLASALRHLPILWCTR
jgi:hypothetical protein